MIKFFRNIKIGTKILIVLLATSLIALLTISVISYTEMLNLNKYSQDANLKLGITASEESQDALQLQAEEYLYKITQEQSAAIDGTFSQISAEITTLRNFLEQLYANPDNFVGRDLPLPNETEMGVASSKYMLPPGVEQTEAIEEEVRLLSNCEYVFSGVLENDINLDNIYLGTYSGVSYRYSRSNLYDATYDPRERGWFTEAVKAEGETIWLDTYVDSYGSIGITCAAAFHDESGEIIGVVATDITLKSLKENIEDTKIGDSGYAYLLDNQGTFIVHPDYGTEGFETHPLNTATDAWKEVLQSMAEGKSDVAIAMQDGVESYISYAPIETVGWSLGVTVPLEEIVAPAKATKATIDGYIVEAQTYIQTILSDILMQFIVLFAVCAMVLVFFAFVLSSAITKPIQELVTSVQKIGSGNLDIQIEESSTDEVGQLARACNKMSHDLKTYVDQLVITEREKERLSGELNVAAEIQNSMLPALFPIFDNRAEFEIYATMDPAKEVGGDFYDFFFIDSDHLAIVIADVSGKGVPAALFMVIAKTLLKNQSQTSGGYSPKEVLAKVNNQLCENNEAEMFVTAWFGILQVSTGEIICANAGHEHPAICRKDGNFELWKNKNGFVLAGMEDMSYQDITFSLGKGDKLYIYTDGVPEATNNEKAMYGTTRMLETLCSLQEKSPEEILRGVKEDMDDFVGDAPQFDDITMLALYYKGI